MKLVTFSEANNPSSPVKPGLLFDGETDGGLVDLTLHGFPDTLAFLAAEPYTQAECALAQPTLPADTVRLLAPISAPPRIFGIGVNYAEHATESKIKTQAVPTVFLILSSAVIGPGAPVILPRASTKVDYEVELAVVIGKPGYQIPAADWEQHVFGYTILNDISARDVQLATTQWSLGKSFPTFAPMGPWIVSKDEISDPHALNISLTIAGEKLQDSNTDLLIFKIPALIEYISGIVPLQTGDIISTGTPAGVGMGRDPQRWLQPGEEMVLHITGLGELRNPIIAE